MKRNSQSGLVLVEVLCIVFGIALLQKGIEARQEALRTERRRKTNERFCKEFQNDQVYGTKQGCQPPRFGIPRKWFEQPTYQELVGEKLK